MNTGARRQAAMPFIMVTVLIDMMAIGLIVPVLPDIVGSFTTSQTEQAWWYGAVTMAFSLANFVASPIIGALGDRYGRRPVLLLGFCALALSFFVTAMATALWMLIVVRLFSGAMQSNASVANAYVADITPPEQRARRFGLLGAMFGLGFILGPSIGGLLGSIDIHWPFFLAGALALANLVYGYVVLPESLPPAKRRPVDWKLAANPFASLRALSRLKGVGLLVAVVACSSLAQFILYTSWVLYNTFKFGWGPFQNGLSLFTVGIVSAIVQGMLLGPMLKRWSPQLLLLVGLASSAVAYFAYGAATQGWMMYAVIVLNVLSFAVPASVAGMISGAADATEQGRTMGAVSGLQSLMAALGPVVAAPLLGLVSHLPRGDWKIGAPFYFCAALQVASLYLAWRHVRAHPRDGAKPVDEPPATHAAPLVEH